MSQQSLIEFTVRWWAPGVLTAAMWLTRAAKWLTAVVYWYGVEVDE